MNVYVCVYVCERPQEHLRGLDTCGLLPVIGATCLQLAVAQACQESYYLDGLAKAHLISQNASCLLAVQFPHPPDTCLLIPGQQKQACSTKRQASTTQTTHLIN